MTGFKRVFIDTAPIIYFLENSSQYMEAMEKFFAKCVKEHMQIVTSTLTVEEYLVSPYSNGKIDYIDNFKKFIDYMDIEVVDIDLQIATAVVKKCDMFFTNDKQLRQEKEIPCMTVEDMSDFVF